MSDNQFQSKFKGQIQSMGKNGIVGTMDKNKKKINNNMNLINNKINISQKEEITDSNNPFLNWEEVYNNENKKSKSRKKGSKSPNRNKLLNNNQSPPKPNMQKIQKKENLNKSRIQNNGEMIMKTSNNNINNLKNNANNNNLNNLNGRQFMPNYNPAYPLVPPMNPFFHNQPPMNMPIPMINMNNNQNANNMGGVNYPQYPMNNMMMNRPMNPMNQMNPMNPMNQMNPNQSPNPPFQIMHPQQPLPPMLMNNQNYPMQPKLNYFNENNKDSNGSMNQIKNNFDLNLRHTPDSLKGIPEGKFVEYKPYTLKDYKELTRTPVVMGSLGANIGTKEWEEKKEKRNKMNNYCNRINQSHKGINKLKKDTPQDEIEKEIKTKVEASHRHKTYEYGKLVRPYKIHNDAASPNENLNVNFKVLDVNNNLGIKDDKNSSNINTNVAKDAKNNNKDFFYKDLGVINEDEEKNFKLKMMENNSNNELSGDRDLNTNEINPYQKNLLENNMETLNSNSNKFNSNKNEPFMPLNMPYNNDNNNLYNQKYDNIPVPPLNVNKNNYPLDNFKNDEQEDLNKFENNFNSAEEEENLQKLLRQNEEYESKINDIKNSLF